MSIEHYRQLGFGQLPDLGDFPSEETPTDKDKPAEPKPLKLNPVSPQLSLPGEFKEGK